MIPKSPSRNLLDADPATLGPLMAAVQKVAAAVQKAFGAEGILIQQFNEPAAGQTVFHLHVHILPRKAGVSLRPHTARWRTTSCSPAMRRWSGPHSSAQRLLPLLQREGTREAGR